MPGQLRQGQYSNNPVVGTGVDAAGGVIPGQIANKAAIDVHLTGFVNQNIDQACGEDYCSQLYCCGVVTNFAYNGLATGRETFRTTSTISYNSTSTNVSSSSGEHRACDASRRNVFANRVSKLAVCDAARPATSARREQSDYRQRPRRNCTVRMLRGIAGRIRATIECGNRSWDDFHSNVVASTDDLDAIGTGSGRSARPYLRDAE